MADYILSIDQGTTGSTALIIDATTLEVIDKLNQEFKQFYPKPSWVEHDLNEIWTSVADTTKKLLEKNNIDVNKIKCIGITNQRETTCAFDKNGEPLAKAIVWQDRRTEEFCNQNKDKFEELKMLTGLPLDAYFSATKMRWLLKNDGLVQDAYKRKDLCFGTIDTFLLYKLTNGKSFKTDATNASRTNLMSLEEVQWNEKLTSFFEVDKELLPEICDSFCEFGQTNGLDFLPDGIPITCLFGDQQSALFGQSCINKGDLKCTYGTGAFLLLNTGEEIVPSNNGLLTTVAYKYNEKTVYALEGSCYIAGAAVQWLRDHLNIIPTSPDIESLALEVEDEKEMDNILFMPFFTGIGSPYWISNAKAAILGLTRDTENKHIARACLEGIALSIRDLVNAFENDGGTSITEIKVDGGACANNFLMQLQSNYLEKKVLRPKNIETTSTGAALGAAIGAGLHTLDSIRNLWKLDKDFISNALTDYFKNKSALWDTYIKRLYL